NASTNVGSSGSDTGPSPGSGSNDSSGSSTGGSTNISAGGSNSGSDTNTNVGGNSDTGSGSNVGSGSSAGNDTSTTGSAGTDAGSSSGSSVTPTQKITGVITVNDQIGSIPFTYNTVQTIPLNLIVTDKQSKPISGATVIVSDNEGHILFQGISNSMGKVS
ncbi:hypothetical protein IQA55_07435, partial [Leptospira borgpetersenii serovar Tarassovi]|nr:hypothetical protein [Leptospira borgpetersenii serovar Tarassovi]